MLKLPLFAFSSNAGKRRVITPPDVCLFSNVCFCLGEKMLKLAEGCPKNCPLIHLLFISGKSKEAEIKRINKELANIRSKFKGK